MVLGSHLIPLGRLLMIPSLLKVMFSSFTGSSTFVYVIAETQWKVLLLSCCLTGNNII